jgi:hypothetical protein
MKARLLIILLGLVTSLGLLGGFGISAASAQSTPTPAASASPRSASPLASGDSVPSKVSGSAVQRSGTDPHGHHDGVIHRVPGPDYLACSTLHSWSEGEDVLDIVIFQYNQYTYWCWNGRWVTTHSSWETGTVTTTGEIGGWSYDGVINSHWHCFYADSHACSGNFVESQGKFTDCIIHIGCPTETVEPGINQNVYYNGKWNASFF